MNSFEKQICDSATSNPLAREVRIAILRSLDAYAVLDEARRSEFLAQVWRKDLRKESRRLLLPENTELEEIPPDPPQNLQNLFIALQEQCDSLVNEWLLRTSLPGRIVVSAGSVSLADWKKEPERYLDSEEINGKRAFLNVGGSVIAAGRVTFVDGVPHFWTSRKHICLPPDPASDMILEFRATAFSIHLQPQEMSAIREGSILKSRVLYDECFIDIFVGTRCVARGELIAVDDRFGIRIGAVVESGGSLSPRQTIRDTDSAIVGVIHVGNGKIKLRDLILLEPGKIVETDRPTASPWTLEFANGVNLTGEVTIVDECMSFVVQMTPAAGLDQKYQAVLSPAGSGDQLTDRFATPDVAEDRQSTVEAVALLKEALSEEVDFVYAAIENESPQVIAYLLCFMEPERAAQILDRLPLVLRPNIYERLARKADTDDRFPAMILPILNRRFAAQRGRLKIGGERFADQVREFMAEPIQSEEPGEDSASGGEAGPTLS